MEQASWKVEEVGELLLAFPTIVGDLEVAETVEVEVLHVVQK